MKRETSVADERYDVASDLYLGIVLTVVGLLGVLCGVLRSTNSTEGALGLLFTAFGLRLVFARRRDA